MSLAGGASRNEWKPEDQQSLLVSSFVGAPERWRENVPVFGRLRQPAVYPGIDLVYYGDADRRMEYDFLLTPGSDPSRIRMRFIGAQKIKITSEGDLVLQTAAGDLVHKRPRILQDRREVMGHYRWHGRDIGIALTEPYDRSRPLRIDPVISFAAFYGGEGEDVITAASGLAVAGYTNSIAFPGTTTPAMGGYDAFYLSTGRTKRLVYIGGSKDDKAWAIYNPELQFNTEVFAIAGETESPDFPVIARWFVGNSPVESGPELHRPFAGGRTDAFIMFFRSDFSSGTMHGSFLLGGSGDDRILGLTGAGSALYGVGDTTSVDLPVATGMLRAPGGGRDRDGWMLVMSSIFRGGALSALASYWGGEGDDSLRSVSFVAADALLIAGSTASDHLPVARALQGQRAGASDGYVALISSIGSAGTPLFASYWGGTGEDSLTAASLRPDRTLWLFGDTTSKDLLEHDPVQSPGGYRGGAGDAFLAKLSVPAITEQPVQLLRSSYLGGSGADSLSAVQMNQAGDVFLAGTTESPDFPQKDPLQPQYGGGESDAWVAQLSPTGELLFSTYYGGAGIDTGVALGLGLDGELLLAGASTSITLGGAERSSAGSGPDAFLMRFSSPQVALRFNGMVARNAMTGVEVLPAVLPEREVQLQIRSADPSQLLVSTEPATQGSASVSIPWNGESRFIYLHGLTDSGGTEVIVSATGVPERRYPVRFRPLSIGINLLNNATQAIPGEPQRPALKSGQIDPGYIMVGFQARSEDGTLTDALYYPRAGLTPATLRLRTNHPDIAAIADSEFAIHEPSAIVRGPGNGFEITAGRAGATEIVAEVDDGAGTLPLLVEGPRFVFGNWTPVSRLLINVPVRTDMRPDSRAPAVEGEIISDDPEAGLLVTGNSGNPPAPRLRIPNLLLMQSNSVRVVGGTPGRSVKLRLVVAGQPDVVGEWPVQPVYAVTSAGTLPANGEGTLTIWLRNPNVVDSFFAGVTARTSFRITNMTPEIAVAEQAEVAVQPAPQAIGQVRVKALAAAGEAVFTVASNDGIPLWPGNERVVMPIAPAVPAAPFTLTAPFAIGANLQASGSISRQVSGTVITLTSSDPSKLVISGSEATLGQGSFELRANDRTFLLQSIGSATGPVEITATASTGEVRRTTVRLVPALPRMLRSGGIEINRGGTLQIDVGWAPDTGAGYLIGANATAVTPDLAEPLFQRIRPGASLPSVTVVSSAPEVVAITARGTSGFTLNARQAGTATLTLSTEAPVARNAPLRVDVTDGSLVVDWRDRILGKDLARRVTAGAPGNAPVTFTSSDPAKLSIDGGRTATGNSVLFAALADTGSVQVLVEAPGFPSRTLQVELVRPVLTMRSPSGGVMEGVAGGGAVNLPVWLGTLAGGVVRDDRLRAGIEPLTFTVRSSRPDIAPSVESQTITSGAITVPMRATGPGEVTYELIPPAGWDTSDRTYRTIVVRYRNP